MANVRSSLFCCFLALHQSGECTGASAVPFASRGVFNSEKALVLRDTKRKINERVSCATAAVRWVVHVTEGLAVWHTERRNLACLGRARKARLAGATVVWQDMAEKRITREALRTLTNWMKMATHAPRITNIAYSEDDFSATLGLRVAGETLGMGQYAGGIVIDYCSTVGERVPQPDEALTIIEHAIGEEDVLLTALADRMAQLYSINDEEQFGYADKVTWDDALQRPEFHPFYKAMEESEDRQKQTVKVSITQTAREKEAAWIAEARKQKLARRGAERLPRKGPACRQSRPG